MRQHRSNAFCMAMLFLLGFFGCVADSAKPVPDNRRKNMRPFTLSCLVLILIAGFSSAAPLKSVAATTENEPASSGGVEERGVPTKPGGTLPPHLCHPVTRMVTQCRCNNPADCQVLLRFCPETCPAGSQTCECIPGPFRGTPADLPSQLCHFEVPQRFTQCSCHNVADCQVLSTLCPRSCPVGSQSCECAPLLRR